MKNKVKDSVLCTDLMISKINHYCTEVFQRITEKHIGCFKGMDHPLFLISMQYPGVWMEHVYDSVFLARLKPDLVNIAENAINLFIDRQRDNGQLPFRVMDGNNEYEYALFSTAHSHYMYFEDKYERVIVVSPDGLLDLESIFAEDLDRNIFSDSLLNDTVTSVIEKDGQIIVTSVSDQEELDTYEAEGWSLGKEETVLDAKTFDVIFERADYTEIETGEVYEGAINITYDGEIPESMKIFMEYDKQTEDMRTVTIVSNPGAENEKTESVQVPKGLQVAITDLADDEMTYALYADAACTQTFEGEWDINADLTIYVKW